ncbi:hypothetical protein E3E26_06115 [Thermococcus sp. LS1]|uniref:hypothetical protein n=1 Tax=Thermococcus sp. LS1 TaxID=1638259 RepID=UPI00143A68AA|nr:hypothetical protein [Thermococcus sp. LS1]NJD99358.1 hypothetical protein [Thermococcus sp. LS1]
MDPMAKAFEEAKKNPKMRKKLKIKAAFSLLLFVMFLGVVFITIGTIIASKTGSFLGMTQLDFLKLRAQYGIIMMFLIIIHLAMNRSIMKKELELLFG